MHLSIFFTPRNQKPDFEVARPSEGYGGRSEASCSERAVSQRDRKHIEACTCLENDFHILSKGR
jgi:hypothetical protein